VHRAEFASGVRKAVLVGWALVVVAGITSLPHGWARAEEDREVKARECFALGKYQEALELYGKLYGEVPHPTYLRNIGRCYQKLGNADRAIDSFREYLRQAKDSPEQRAEVEGFIREMENLKKRSANVSASTPAERPPLGRAALPAPAADDARVALAAPATRPESPRLYQRWWFWTVVGAAVAGGVTTAFLASRSTSPGVFCPECTLPTTRVETR
jgi:tetratricopeptide (TPR) repeat protein